MNSNIGTPLDYTQEEYRVYFEVVEFQGKVLSIIENYLGEGNLSSLVKVEYGYELDLAIQRIPELTKELVDSGIAVYQVLRLAKTKDI